VNIVDAGNTEYRFGISAVIDERGCGLLGLQMALGLTDCWMYICHVSLYLYCFECIEFPMFRCNCVVFYSPGCIGSDLRKTDIDPILNISS
jgi:hypothetical protein